MGPARWAPHAATPLQVPNPMSLAALEKAVGGLASAADFARLLRRIPANSLRFTASFPGATADLRRTAVRVLEAIEKELAKVAASSCPGQPPLPHRHTKNRSRN